MKKALFLVHNELYKYSRMPFGLKNTPATFYRAMNVITATVKLQHALVCIYDIRLDLE